MSETVKISQQKDSLYYSDLVYVIKKLAGLEVIDDEETNKRIISREESRKQCQSGANLGTLSDFEIELFDFSLKIAKKAGVKFKTPEEMAKYPHLVMESLKEYEEPKENSIEKEPKKLKIELFGR